MTQILFGTRNGRKSEPKSEDKGHEELKGFRGEGAGMGYRTAYLELIPVLVLLQLLNEGSCGSHSGQSHISIGAAQALLQDTVQGAHVLGQCGHYVVRQLCKYEQS